MQTRQTPYGTLSWEGKLTEDTLVTLTPPGKKARTSPLYRLVSLTNGDILQYLP